MTQPPDTHPAPSKAHEHAAKRDWPRYFQAVEGKPARDTLLKALELFEKEDAASRASAGQPVVPSPARLAVDLGCGSGRDTFELLRRGWRVLAIDSSQLGLELLEKQVHGRGLPAEQLECRAVGFEGLALPPATLVNASYSLPFCDPEAFPALWRTISTSIQIGGRFAGQFFGPRDDWSLLPDRSHHSRSQVDELLRDFTMESLIESESREAGATGEIKDWHIFHVVAKRRA
jgi:tellurite methyltransferase